MGAAQVGMCLPLAVVPDDCIPGGSYNTIASTSAQASLAVAPPKQRKPGLASPLNLASFDPEDAALLVVVIEPPKGSRNKYAYDPDERIFSLTKVLPAGMEFPYDFGFIPSTEADDGDPLDALLYAHPARR